MSSPQASGDLHVVTENGEQCFMWRSSQLTYIAQDRRELPMILATKFGQLATKLDLSYNSLTSFNYISKFTNLSELILDNNCLEDGQLQFERNLRLKTLSLNKNKLHDLHKLVSSIKFAFPNLEFLSLIGNPLCPSQIQGHERPQPQPQQLSDHSELSASTLADHNRGRAPVSWHIGANPDATSLKLPEFNYQKYRHFVIYHLPNLRFLDSNPVSGRERDEALRRCFYLAQADASGGRGIDSAPTSGTENKAAAANNGDRDAASFRLSIMVDDDYCQREDQHQRRQQTASTGQPRGVFSKLVYKYTGKNSEGNRFICNQDL